MCQSILIQLPDRALISVNGPDARAFLQGLVSNDVNKVNPNAAIYSALLTPQGKYLFDFFVLQPNENDPNHLWIDIDQSQADTFLKRLRVFRLRSQVELTSVEPEKSVFAVLGSKVSILAKFDRGLLFSDPRHTNLGYRLLLDKSTLIPTVLSDLTIGTTEDYEDKRIALAIPKSDQDLIQEKTTLLEAGFDELNGLDWDKGCYMGQEVTARTKYRGLVKKRLFPLKREDSIPTPGSEIYQGQKKVGLVTSCSDNLALASLNVKAALAVLNKGETIHLENNEEALKIMPPDWLKKSLKKHQDE